MQTFIIDFHSYYFVFNKEYFINGFDKIIYTNNIIMARGKPGYYITPDGILVSGSYIFTNKKDAAYAAGNKV